MRRDGAKVTAHADRHGHLVGQRLRQVIGNALGNGASLLDLVVMIDRNQRPLDSEPRLQLLFERGELGRVQVDPDRHQTELARPLEQPADLGSRELQGVRDLVLSLTFIVVEFGNESGQVYLVYVGGHRLCSPVEPCRKPGAPACEAPMSRIRSARVLVHLGAVGKRGPRLQAPVDAHDHGRAGRMRPMYAFEWLADIRTSARASGTFSPRHLRRGWRKHRQISHADAR